MRGSLIVAVTIAGSLGGLPRGHLMLGASAPLVILGRHQTIERVESGSGNFREKVLEAYVFKFSEEICSPPKKAAV